MQDIPWLILKPLFMQTGLSADLVGDTFMACTRDAKHISLQIGDRLGSAALAAALAFSILASPVAAVTNEQLLFLEVIFLNAGRASKSTIPYLQSLAWQCNFSYFWPHLAIQLQ